MEAQLLLERIKCANLLADKKEAIKNLITFYEISDNIDKDNGCFELLESELKNDLQDEEYIKQVIDLIYFLLKKISNNNNDVILLPKNSHLISTLLTLFQSLNYLIQGMIIQIIYVLLFSSSNYTQIINEILTCQNGLQMLLEQLSTNKTTIIYDIWNKLTENNTQIQNFISYSDGFDTLLTNIENSLNDNNDCYIVVGCLKILSNTVNNNLISQKLFIQNVQFNRIKEFITKTSSFPLNIRIDFYIQFNIFLENLININVALSKDGNNKNIADDDDDSKELYNQINNVKQQIINTNDFISVYINLFLISIESTDELKYSTLRILGCIIESNSECQMILYSNNKLINLIISSALYSENGKIRSASIYLYNSIIHQNNTICNDIITQFLHDDDNNNNNEKSMSDSNYSDSNKNYIKILTNIIREYRNYSTNSINIITVQSCCKLLICLLNSDNICKELLTKYLVGNDSLLEFIYILLYKFINSHENNIELIFSLLEVLIIWNNNCSIANSIVFNKSFYCLMYVNALSVKNLSNPLNYLGINQMSFIHCKFLCCLFISTLISGLNNDNELFNSQKLIEVIEKYIGLDLYIECLSNKPNNDEILTYSKLLKTVSNIQYQSIYKILIQYYLDKNLPNIIYSISGDNNENDIENYKRMIRSLDKELQKYISQNSDVVSNNNYNNNITQHKSDINDSITNQFTEYQNREFQYENTISELKKELNNITSEYQQYKTKMVNTISHIDGLIKEFIDYNTVSNIKIYENTVNTTISLKRIVSDNNRKEFDNLMKLHNKELMERNSQLISLKRCFEDLTTGEKVEKLNFGISIYKQYIPNLFKIIYKYGRNEGIADAYKCLVDIHNSNIV